MGNYGPNLKDYTLSCLLIRYFMNLSTNTSFRIGLMAHLDETFENYSEIRDLNNAVLVPAFRLTYFQHYIGVPVLINIEKTNSFITPYFFMGFMPMLYRLSNKNNINDFKYIGKPSFEIDIRVGAGLKVNINDQLNLKAELKSNLASDPLNLNFGIDYNFKLKQKQVLFNKKEF